MKPTIGRIGAYQKKTKIAFYRGSESSFPSQPDVTEAYHCYYIRYCLEHGVSQDKRDMAWAASFSVWLKIAIRVAQPAQRSEPQHLHFCFFRVFETAENHVRS
jgi:hypothetical protein